MIQEREARALHGYPMLVAIHAVNPAVVSAPILGVVEIDHLGRGGAPVVVVVVFVLLLGWRGLTAKTQTRLAPWSCSDAT